MAQYEIKFKDISIKDGELIIKKAEVHKDGSYLRDAKINSAIKDMMENVTIIFNY